MNKVIQKLINTRPDSCNISINAKGPYSGEIKIYAETLEDVLAMKKALLKATELEILIKEKKYTPP